MQLAGQQLKLVVNDSTARYPLTIDPSFQQQAYLKASNSGEDDDFGFSVAISGDTLVVGAPQEQSNASGVNGDQSNNNEDSAGAAYVFFRNGNTWSQQAYLKKDTVIGSFERFGSSVAIDGDTIVVGADSNDTDGVTDAGAAYVFTRSGTTWSQQSSLQASNSGGIHFGVSIDIDGDTLVVGANREGSNATGVNGDQNNNDMGNSGAAYVFTRSGDGWSQQAYLKASNTDKSDQFGISVAISSDTVVVGANREESTSTGVNGDQNNNAEDNVGAAYVFSRSGTAWSQQAYLKASNADRADEFGWSVDIAGDTIVIGAINEQSEATGVNGDQNNNDGFKVGAAYVFTRSGTTWSQQAYLKSNTDTFQNFGSSVAIFGNTVVVGAPSESSNATGVDGDPSNNSLTAAGAAYVFTRNGTNWSHQAYLKASNTDNGDHFGVSLAISDNTLVIGANDEESSATGVNDDQSSNAASDAGAAYVFTLPTESGGENNAFFTIETAILELPVVVVGSVNLSARLRFEQQGPDAVVILESAGETMETSDSPVTFSPETGVATLPRVSLLNNGTVQSVVSAELVLIGGTSPLKFLVTNIVTQNP